MEGVVTIEKARQIMSGNFVGPEELSSLYSMIDIQIPDKVPVIPYSIDIIESLSDTHILLLGVNMLKSGDIITIRKLNEIFGKNPEISEPCFYNQDWYICESFLDRPINNGWFFIQKHVSDGSRAMNPEELLKYYSFPLAIECAYAFFVYYLLYKEILWPYDFIWCSDLDHNGDRIYVGKYFDVDGVNKNGFSIHRHLKLRKCYGAISVR